MKPENSLQCSQEPVTEHYPTSLISTLTLFIFTFYLPSTLSSPKWSLPWRFSDQICYDFISHAC